MRSIRGHAEDAVGVARSDAGTQRHGGRDQPPKLGRRVLWSMATQETPLGDGRARTVAAGSTRSVLVQDPGARSEPVAEWKRSWDRTTAGVMPTASKIGHAAGRSGCWRIECGQPDQNSNRGPRSPPLCAHRTGDATRRRIRRSRGTRWAP